MDSSRSFPYYQHYDGAFLEPDDDNLLASFRRIGAPATETVSNRDLDLVNDWLKHCQHHHRDCATNRQPVKYPTRLLNIQDDVIRLVTRDDLPLRGPYATISHCWGRRPFDVLTSTTLSRFRKGLNLEEVLPTFRDAITVCRKLNISYLWIDCYCVMQSEDKIFMNTDFQHEIAEMGDIYSNAILNLGFSASQSPYDGFSMVRTQHRLPWLEVPPEPGAAGRPDILIFKDDFLFRNMLSIFAAPGNNVILSRAWCLQERFLCKRMVHFCKTGIYWECDTLGITSDIFPFSYRLFMIPLEHAPPFSLQDVKTMDAIEGIPDPNAWTWRNVTCEYSGMALSWPTKDKFAACNAVAELIADRSGDEYVAGFYRRTLMQDLLWARSMRRTDYGPDQLDEPVRQRAREWRAPSWSWASMDVTVTFSESPTVVEQQLDAISVASIVSLDYELVDPLNPYGALKSASLTLEGWAASVNRVPLQDKVRLGKIELYPVYDDDREWRTRLIIFILDGPAEIRELSKTSCHGLVLTQVSDELTSKPQVFRRLGIWKALGGIEDRAWREFSKRIVEII